MRLQVFQFSLKDPMQGGRLAREALSATRDQRPQLMLSPVTMAGTEGDGECFCAMQ